MITDYKVIAKSDRQEFEDAIKFYLQRGYRPHGGMSTPSTGSTSWSSPKFYYVQPMVREEGEVWN